MIVTFTLKGFNGEEIAYETPCGAEVLESAEKLIGCPLKDLNSYMAGALSMDLNKELLHHNPTRANIRTMAFLYKLGALCQMLPESEVAISIRAEE